jgi:hypothetical protein
MNLWKEHIGNTDRPGNFIIEDKGNLGTKLTYCDQSLVNRVYWVKIGENGISGINGYVPAYVREACAEYFTNKVNEIAKEVPQTELPKEESELDSAECHGMEEYSKDDLEKVKGKTKENEELAGREVKDDELVQDELKYKKNESRKRSKGLYLCNECHKTFTGSKANHPCKGGLIETIVSENEYFGRDIGVKGVFEVQYKLDGKTQNIRVIAYDEGDAKRYVEKIKVGSKVVKTRKIRESRVKEDKIPGGLGDNKKDSQFDQTQLEMGVKVEMEHTNDPKKAREIAKDHLTEDPKYYTKLAKMEAGGCDESKRVNEGVRWVRSYEEGGVLTSDSGFEAQLDTGKVQVTVVSSSKDLAESVSEFLMQKINDDWDDETNESKVNERYDPKSTARTTVEELISDMVSSTGMSYEDAVDILRDSIPNESWVADREARKGDAKEGKVALDKDSESTKIKKLTEGVDELIDEMDDIPVSDRKAVRKAIQNNVIKNEWPTEEVMIDELSQLEDFIDPTGLDEDIDIKMAYLKYVLVPKALSGVNEAKKSSNEGLIRLEKLVNKAIKNPDSLTSEEGDELSKLIGKEDSSYKDERKSGVNENEGMKPASKEEAGKYYARELVKHLEKMDKLTDEEKELLNKAKKELDESKVEEGLFSAGKNYFIPNPVDGKRGEHGAIRAALQKAVDSGLAKGVKVTDAGFTISGVKDPSAINKLMPSGVSVMRESVVNEEFHTSITPGQKQETPEERKRREALVSAAAKAVEGMGEDELEAYAEQIKKRSGK